MVEFILDGPLFKVGQYCKTLIFDGHFILALLAFRDKTAEKNKTPNKFKESKTGSILFPIQLARSVKFCSEPSSKSLPCLLAAKALASLRVISSKISSGGSYVYLEK